MIKTRAAQVKKAFHSMSIWKNNSGKKIRLMPLGRSNVLQLLGFSKKTFSSFLVLTLTFSGCIKLEKAVPRSEAASDHAASPTPSMPSYFVPTDQYESYELETVLPGSSATFDPFTYGRPGSPFGPGRLFAAGIQGSRCGPMNLPMSPDFADPGDVQGVILIAGNGLECVADIDHDKPGAAIAFTIIAGIFTNAPWRIVNQTSTTVTISNGVVTLRFTYRITTSTTFITKVEYL